MNRAVDPQSLIVTSESRVFIQILLRTPTWVFPLFFALLALGLWMRRDRTTSVVRAMCFPMVMLVVSLAGVTASFGISIPAMGGWLIGLIIMLAIGSRQIAAAGARYDAPSHAVSLPGSWRPLVLMMTIFLLKYTVGVMLALGRALGETMAVTFIIGNTYQLDNASLYMPGNSIILTKNYLKANLPKTYTNILDDCDGNNLFSLK